MVISVVAARYLGPSGMGRQSFIAFVSLSATALLSAGIYQGLLRFVGESLGQERPGVVRDLTIWATRVQVAAAGIGGAAVAMPGLAGAEPRLAWVLAGLVTALSVGAAVPQSALAGAQRWREMSIVGLVSGTLAVPATIAVLAAGGGITGMFAVEAATVAMGFAATSVLTRRMLRDIGAYRRPERGPRRAAGRFSALSTIGVLTGLIVWKRSEFFFLEAYSSDAQLAFYSIAFAAVSGLVLIPDALGNVLSPAFATLHGAGARDRIRSGYWRAQRLLLTLSLPLTAGLLALGPALLQVVYGDDYREAGPVFLIMMSVFPLIPLRTVAAGLLVGLGMLRFRLISDSLAACVTIGLNFFFVPMYDSLGAALANVGGQLAVVVPVVIYTALLQRPIGFEVRFIVATAAASAAAGGAAWLLLSLFGGAAGLFLGAVAGAAVFVSLAAGLRILSPDDGTWLAETVGAHLGQRVGKGVLVLAGSHGRDRT